MSQIGENILALRKLKGLSQGVCAEKLNVPRTTFQSWENGDAEPGLTKISAIADVLGVSPAAVLKGVVDMEKKSPSATQANLQAKSLEEIRVNLNKLASVIGRLAGLDTEESFGLLSSEPWGSRAFQDLRKRGKLSKKGK